MNPAETAAILRQFNEWRRGDEDIPQFDPRDIGEAIDAAVEMIDRLEAAEKECDALRAKIEQMEQQEPYCTAIGPGDWTYQISSPARPGMALYALPGAQGEEK